MLRVVFGMSILIILIYSSFGQTSEVNNGQALTDSSAIPRISHALANYCDKIDQSFKKYGWGDSKCRSYKWNHVRNSVLGDPLPWVVFGGEGNGEENVKGGTIILCGIHGDEITPVKFCFDIMEHINSNKELFQNRMVLVAPLVNPDSFFKKRPTRTNARKVDINRNFPTADWSAKALKYWDSRCHKDPRRFPGAKALSEPEVLFQVNLLIRYSPSKILAVHAPLTMLDYDGPQDMQPPTSGLSEKMSNEANELLIQMSRMAKGYRIINFPFYPGSLGNYAGNERNIPTYTIELPSSNPSKSLEYWGLFRAAIEEAIQKDLRKKLGEKTAQHPPATQEIVLGAKEEENKSSTEEEKTATP